MPGRTAEQTLESLINGELSNIRGDAGEVCKGVEPYPYPTPTPTPNPDPNPDPNPNPNP